MAILKAKEAWAVSYTPANILEMSEAYDAEALQMLNEHLAKEDYVVISQDPQGYPVDLVMDFPADAAEPYRVLIKLAQG